MWLYLFYTFVLEIPILYFFFRGQDSLKNIILIGVLLSSFTWPLAMYAYHQWAWNIYFLEFLIAFIESLMIKLYWQTTWQKAVLGGYSMNAFSFIIGKILFG